MGRREQQAIKTTPPGAKGERNTGKEEMATPVPFVWPGAWRVVSLSDYQGHIGISGAPLIPLDLGGCPTRWLAYTLAARCIEKQWGEGEDREEQSLEVFPSSFWLSYWDKMSWFQALSIRPCAPHSFFCFWKFGFLTKVIWHQWPARRIIWVISMVSAWTNYSRVIA